MKRNPLIPFIFTAVIGIILVIGMSFWGIHNQEQAKKKKNRQHWIRQRFLNKTVLPAMDKTLKARLDRIFKRLEASIQKSRLPTFLKMVNQAECRRVL